MNIHVLFLAASAFETDIQEGSYPSFLTELDGISVLERIVARTRDFKNVSYSYALRTQDVERFHLANVIELLTPGAKLVKVPNQTKGSACTAFLAACACDPEDEILLISANELVDVNFAEIVENFRKRDLDAGTICFRSLHPRYSFVKVNEKGLVVEAAQQNPISHYATAGVFWFAKTEYFTDAVKQMIRKNACVGISFYIAPAFNEMILQQYRIGIEEIDSACYTPLKTERQLQHLDRVTA